MTTVAQIVAQTAAQPDAHRRQVDLVRASLQCCPEKSPARSDR